MIFLFQWNIINIIPFYTLHFNLNIINIIPFILLHFNLNSKSLCLIWQMPLTYPTTIYIFYEQVFQIFSIY